MLDTLGKRRLALAVPGGDGRYARLHRRFMDTWRCRASGLHGAAFSERGAYVGGVGLVDCLGQHGHFGAFLYGKRQPTFQLGIELVFTAKVHRAVQQRARRRYP